MSQVSSLTKYSEVANDGIMWYNEGLNIVVSGSAGNTPDRIHLSRRCIVDTLSPHAQNGKTSNTLYSIYQYTDPRTSKVVYIGLTKDPKARFKQHISPKGTLYSLAQELKQEGLELIASILETTENLQEAKELEKKWIRAKAPLLNQVHNQEEIERREQEMEISSWMQLMGWTHEEARIFVEYFLYTGDAYTYDAIEYAVQAAREILGISGKFTPSEILHITLRYRGIEK